MRLYSIEKPHGRSVILTHFVRITSYNRSYAATLLRWYGTRVRDDNPNQPKQYITTKKKA